MLASFFLWLCKTDFIMKIKYVFQMLNTIRDCFVTGKWEEDQDAATLLKEDGK